MSRRPEILSLALLVIACKRDVSPPSPEASAPSSTPSTPSTPSTIADAAPGDAAEDAKLDAIGIQQELDDFMRRNGVDPMHPRKLTSIGHTSVVFRIDLTDGRRIVFKPRSKRGKDRWKGEIAAFRLGGVLGIDGAVPSAWEQSFGIEELNKAEHDEKTTKLLSEEVVRGPGDNLVRGAYMPWIDDYEVLALEKEPLFSQWRGWLKKDGAIPDDKKEWARAISTLILFDYVTGNWDRWSGGNVATSKGKILYVDNDGAFFETPPKDGLARNKRYLESVDRFSKSFVDALRKLTRETLVEAIRDYLSDKAYAGVLARRDEALAIVDQKELFFR